MANLRSGCGHPTPSSVMANLRSRCGHPFVLNSTPNKGHFIPFFSGWPHRLRRFAMTISVLYRFIKTNNSGFNHPTPSLRHGEPAQRVWQTPPLRHTVQVRVLITPFTLKRFDATGLSVLILNQE